MDVSRKILQTITGIDMIKLFNKIDNSRNVLEISLFHSNSSLKKSKNYGKLRTVDLNSQLCLYKKVIILNFIGNDTRFYSQ